MPQNAGVGSSEGTRGVLLTGVIGRATAPRLQRDGWDVRAFDLVDGNDLRDPLAARDAADAVRAARRRTPPHRARRVLLAGAGVGCSEGEGRPDHLPIEDDHPRRASRAYGRSRRLGEDLCATWSARTRIPTVALRPVATYTSEQLAPLDTGRLEIGAFVHVDDVADAVARGLDAPVGAHTRLLLSAAGDVDASRARDVLGWVPRHDHVPRHGPRTWSARLDPTRAWRNRQTRQV